MSAITTIPRSKSAPMDPITIPDEERGVMRDVSWNFYDRLTDAMGESCHIHVAYDGKDLEIMVVGPVHERRKELLSSFIEEVSEGLKVNFQAFGQTTWKRAELERGLESDLCYYFDPSKMQAANDAVDRNLSNVTDYPNPDLATEIDFSTPKIDRPGIYAALKVPEIWRLHGDDEVTLTIERLGNDGTYSAAESSQFLRVRPDDVVRWVVTEDSRDRINWKMRLRKWIRTDLKSRSTSGRRTTN
jgi:Uma2 family endonuclease